MSARAGRLGIVVGSGSSASELALALAPDGRAESHMHDQRTVFEVDGAVVVSRHWSGAQNYTPAHLVDHLANLEALAELDCDRVLGLSSVGSLRVDLEVGHVLAPDDFFALGVAPTTFDDARGHQVPGFDSAWREELVGAWWQAEASRPLRDGGIYAHMPGPRFETPSEVRFLATIADVVGMTAAAECIVAGELRLAYASICQVDNLANGIAGEELHPDEVAANAKRNADRLTKDVAALVKVLL